MKVNGFDGLAGNPGSTEAWLSCLSLLLRASLELVKRSKDDARCEHLRQRYGRLPGR